MESIIDYIENTLKDVPDEENSLYRYKRRVFDSMTERANEIAQSGLKDEKVLSDLVISEHPDLKEEYRKFYLSDREKRKTKNFREFLAVGSVCYILLLTAIYLGVSFLTHNWAQSWLIMLGGITVLVDYLFSVAVRDISRMRRIFHPIARVLIAFNIMLTATFIFLCCVVIFHIPMSWIIYLVAVIVLFAADALFLALTKRKLAIINYLLYIPAAMSMLYVILGVLEVIAWDPGWLLMILAVIIDILIVVGIAVENSKYIYRQEVEDVWNEN